MTKICPYHGLPQPCHSCSVSVPQMGAFAHAPATVAPVYVPPHRRPIHFQQSRRDTCAIACCGMVGANLDCPRSFTLDKLETYMTQRGVYLRGQQSLFHALDQPLAWLGLRCTMRKNVGPAEIANIVGNGTLVIMEALGHVIVIFSVNVDGTFVIGDPAMRNVEMSVHQNDYRLKGTGRIWEVRK